MLKSKLRSVSSLLLVCLSVWGCATNRGTVATPAHDNADAIVWLQTSTEYAAVTAGTFAAATAMLASTEAGDDRRMAVVLDIDETVLDNSRYQAQLVFDDARYQSETWDEWIALRAAPPVPGAVDFIRTSQSLGFHVAFITNRACRARTDSAEVCPQKAETLANLAQVGIDTTSTTLFLRGERPPERCRALLTDLERSDGRWSSDKTSRRACVKLDRKIVMLLGDQLGDFTQEKSGPSGTSGREVAAGHGALWGKSWFMLPNPTYGSWRPRASPEKRSLLRGID